MMSNKPKEPLLKIKISLFFLMYFHISYAISEVFLILCKSASIYNCFYLPVSFIPTV